MTHGSLFSGIGGFDLAAEWMGWDNVFHCEWNDFGRRILHHYWPEAISYGDITKTDFTIHRGSIDILTGGFPCQPYSAAGKRLGKEDDRHLWPEMLRAIREIGPRYVVGENVRGLTNWNGGMVFDEVQSDLEIAGYEVLPFILPACAVDAPHRRDRVWFVAYCDNENWAENRLQTRGQNGRFDDAGATRDASDSGCAELQGCIQHRGLGGKGQIKANGRQFGGSVCTTWQDFPTQSPICGRDDGLPAQLDAITFPKWRAESIKGYGNAIVPQVALQIFRAIHQYELDL